MPKEFSLSDTQRILEEAGRLGFPVLWTAKADGVSKSDTAHNPEELWQALTSFEQNHSHHKGGIVTLETNSPRRASPETPLPQQAA
jgi:hypothetical protein